MRFASNFKSICLVSAFMVLVQGCAESTANKPVPTNEKAGSIAAPTPPAKGPASKAPEKGK